MNTDECIKLVCDFVNEKLEGNLEKIKTFDFAEIYKYKKDDIKSYSKYAFEDFNCTFDCDNTNIIRAILFLVWQNKLPKLEYFEIGTGKRYRGDTMNSFRTSFYVSQFDKDNETKNYKKKIDAIGVDGDKLVYYHVKEIIGQNHELLKRIAEFEKTYHTLGNFAILPNNSIVVNEKGKLQERTINQIRGFSPFCDYFDRFLNEIKLCLNKDKTSNENILKLIKANDFYFKENSFENICKINYFEKYSGLEEFFPKHLGRWKNSIKDSSGKIISKYIMTPEEYISFAEYYIDKATEIINYRAEKMIEEIKKYLVKEV